MKTKKALLKKYLPFLPGLIIVVFCMVALNASVLMKQGNEVLKAHYKMQVLKHTQDGFEGVSPQVMQMNALFKKLNAKEQWLYWSIISIGLSGFIMLLLGADRMRKLTEDNEERKQTLTLLENRLAAMEASLDGISIVDAHGSLTYMNKAMGGLHGLNEEQTQNVLQQNWLSLYEGEALETIEKECLLKIKQGKIWADILPIKCNENTKQIEFSIARLADGGMVVTAHDISETLEANKQKEQVQEQLNQAQKMEAVGRLAGGVAHDFNNILAAMNGYAEFLVEDLDEKSKQHGFAVNILKAGQQARSLVDRILAFSRRSDNVTEAMDLLIPLHETLTMLKASLPKSVEVKTNINIDKAPIEGNATQISQLLMNLCVNAKDSMENDKGVLTLSLSRFSSLDDTPLNWLSADLPDPKDNPPIFFEDIKGGRTKLYLSTLAKDREYICLSVEDTGAGIHRSVMEKLFEPFFTTKEVGKGTGLGLSTVHGLITAHRGALKIDATLEKGTRFEIYLPLSNAPALSKTIGKTSIEEKGEATILFVEDQADVREMTVTMIERLGYAVYDVGNGLEALQVLRENKDTFDLVLTDHSMPKMTGLELVYQANMEFPDLPFVLLSGYSEEKLQDLMREHDAIKAIVRKPVSKAVLAKELAAVLKEASNKGAKAA